MDSLRHRRPPRREASAFIDASREFKAGKNQNQLTVEGEDSNVRKIVNTYKARVMKPNCRRCFSGGRTMCPATPRPMSAK